MSDPVNSHELILADAKEDAVDTQSLAVEELPEFELQFLTFRCQPAPGGELLQAVDRGYDPIKPVCGSVRRAVSQPEIRLFQVIQC